MAYATKILWGGGTISRIIVNGKQCSSDDCCTAAFRFYELWVERLHADPFRRWFWTVDEGSDDCDTPLRSVASGCERTEAQARKAAERAARRLDRPRLRAVA